MQSAVLRSHVVWSVCLSVRLCVTFVNCDHIGWNSSKITSRWVSLRCSLSEDPNIRGLLQGDNTRKFGPKVIHPCWFERRRHSMIQSQIAGRMVTDSATSQWRAYRKPPSLCQMVPPRWPPTTSPSSQHGGSICPKVRDWPYLRNWWSDTLHVWF